MRKAIVAGAAVALAVTSLSACTSSDIATPSPNQSVSGSSSGSESASSSSSPEKQPDVTPPSRESLDDADALRLAVSRFEATLIKKGGATFAIRAGDNKDPDSLSVDATGSELREWVTDDDEPASIYTIVDKGVYTSKSGLDPTGKELMDAVAPNAVWMLDSFNAAVYVPLSPARVLQSALAYAESVKCVDEEGGQTCTVKSTGMTTMPGLGSFETPEDGVEVVVTLDKAGDITDLVVFPNDEDFRLSLENIKFGPVTISAPEGETVDYSDLVAEQQKRESASPSPEAE